MVLIPSPALPVSSFPVDAGMDEGDDGKSGKVVPGDFLEDLFEDKESSPFQESPAGLPK